MKINELRLGNWVMYNNQIVKTTGLHYGMFECGCPDDNNWMCTGRISEVHPIELTEEVLLKIGFEKERQLISNLFYLDYETDVDNIIRVKYVIYPKAPSLLKITTSQCGNYECFEFMKRGVKYLHELQNVYYCLTNEELNIEL
jgi:hypothetical protein